VCHFLPGNGENRAFGHWGSAVYEARLTRHEAFSGAPQNMKRSLEASFTDFAGSKNKALRRFVPQKSVI